MWCEVMRMNVKNLITSILCSICISVEAQTTQVDYRTMVEDGKTWRMQVGNIKENVYSYVIDGDTLINGETWKKVRNFLSMPIYENSCFVALREEDKKVYAIAKGSNRPRLLYDFGMKEGDLVMCGIESNAFGCLLDADEKPDTLMGFPFRYYLYLNSIDTITVREQQFRRFTLWFLDPFKSSLKWDGVDEIVWVEGVGSSFGPFAPWMPLLPKGNSILFHLDCSKDKNFIFGSNDFYVSSETSAIRRAHPVRKENQESYDLQGHRLSNPPQKGIYIHDGKKRPAR